MPRRRNNNQIVFIEEPLTEFSTEEMTREPIKPVKDYLKKTLWDLYKDKGEKLECSICLDEIDCEKCACWLTCGHHYHLCCVIKTNKCAMCRG